MAAPLTATRWRRSIRRMRSAARAATRQAPENRDGRRDLLKSFVASRVGRGIRGDDIMTMVHGMCATYFDPADPIDDRDIETIQSWAQTRDDKRIEDGATLARGAP